MDNTNIVGLDKQDEHKRTDKDGDKEESLAERKSRLLRQAEFHRGNIVSAKSAIKQGARPEALFHNALDHATWAVRTRVDSILRPTGVNVASIMPYALSILGFLRRRRLVKPAVGVALAAAGVAMYVQHRRNQSQYSQTPH
jgi:ankyrin repeat protein